MGAAARLIAAMEEYQRRMEFIAMSRRRALLILHRSGMSYQQIAAATGLSKSAVSQLVVRAVNDEAERDPTDLSTVSRITTVAMADAVPDLMEAV